MERDRQKFNTGEIPVKIQNILLKYGEKKKVGIAEYLRTFDRLSLKKIAERMGEGAIAEIEYHLDCYLIHSENKKIIITSGQIT
jgi:hypothetical protein